jgi:hypothetical protein
VRIDPDECRDPDILAAEVRRLRAVIAAGETTIADEDRTPQTHATPGEGSVPPTLTDEEREAIEQMLDEVSGKAFAASWVPATLRSLLERLK